MVLKSIFIAAIGVVALAWSDPSAAQQYRADEFLHLDLSSAVLSPNPIGPAASFAPGPLDVTIDRGNVAAQANAESVIEPKSEPKSDLKPVPKSVPTAVVHAESKPATQTAPVTRSSGIRAADAHAERSVRHAPRALIALHQRNPVEAQARETRVQVWPCKSGGICSWKR
jgi:hypothetical protein